MSDDKTIPEIHVDEMTAKEALESGLVSRGEIKAWRKRQELNLVRTSSQTKKEKDS